MAQEILRVLGTLCQEQGYFYIISYIAVVLFRHACYIMVELTVLLFLHFACEETEDQGG